MLHLSDAQQEEMIGRVTAQLMEWHLREPAIVLLAMHAPLAFLGSQILLAAQPFVGVFTGDAFARDFALLVQDPETIERLVTRLEQAATPASTLSHH